MGYHSNFTLQFTKRDNADFTNEQATDIKEEIAEMLHKHQPDQTFINSDTLLLNYYDTVWYNWLTDLAEVMRKHPELSLFVIREGEDHDDTEKAWWNAKTTEFVDRSDIILERPDPEKSAVTAAVIDSKDNSLTLVAIPTNCEDPEKWLEDNFKNWDSNCTWQIVDTLRVDDNEFSI